MLRLKAMLRIIYVMAKSKKKKQPSSTIALNKKSRRDYLLEDRIEAGLVLEGWEVKSMREGQASIADSFVLLNNGEAFLHGSHVSPLISASTHINPVPNRTRKLLLHAEQLHKLTVSVDRKGYSIIPTALYWSHGKVKLEIALAKGKKHHDKRAAEKSHDWAREKNRILKHS